MQSFSRKSRGGNLRPPKSRECVVIGLTGGIATGKSTLAGVLRSRGAGYYSVDEAAHALYNPGTGVWRGIRRQFGAGISRDGGEIDREKLGRSVMRSKRALGRLEAIVHPALECEARRAIRRMRMRYSLLVVEAGPLLFRLGLHRDVDLVVWTRCPEAVQLKQLSQAKGLSRAAARRWIRSLGPAQSGLARDFARANDAIRIDMRRGGAGVLRAAEFVLRRALGLYAGRHEGEILAFSR